MALTPLSLEGILMQSYSSHPPAQLVNRDIMSMVNKVMHIAPDKYTPDNLELINRIHKIRDEYIEFTLFNKENLLSFFSTVILPLVYLKSENLEKITPEFVIDYTHRKKKTKHVPDVKAESLPVIPLTEDVMREMASMTDHVFTITQVLKKEGLTELLHLKPEELQDAIDERGIDIRKSYGRVSFTYTPPFMRDAAVKRRMSAGQGENGYPVILEIQFREKKKKRLSKKLYDIISEIDAIPLELYERLYCEKSSKISAKKGLNPLHLPSEKQIKEVREKIHDYLIKLATKEEITRYYHDTINWRLGGTSGSVWDSLSTNKPVKELLVNEILSFLKDSKVRHAESKKEMHTSLSREFQKIFIEKEYLQGIDQKKKEAVINYIIERLFSENPSPVKCVGDVRDMRDCIYPYLETMVGVKLDDPLKNSAYKLILSRDQIHNGKIESASKKKEGKSVSDIYGIRVIVESDADIKKVIGSVGLQFGQDNVFKLYSSALGSSVGKSISLPADRNGIFEIKDYRGPNKKPNNYESLQAKVRYNGTVIELQIRTLEQHQNAEYGDASHEKMRFLQTFRRDLRLLNDQNEMAKYGILERFFHGVW